MFAVIAAVIVTIPIVLGQQIAGESESILLQFGDNGITKQTFKTYFSEDFQRGITYEKQFVYNAHTGKYMLNHEWYGVRPWMLWNTCDYNMANGMCHCRIGMPIVRQTVCSAAGWTRQRQVAVGPYSFDVKELVTVNPTRTIYCTKEQIPVYQEYFYPTAYGRIFTTSWSQANDTITLPSTCQPW